MAQELSTTKSVCILAVVVGCFAILWPHIFYPMLRSSLFPNSEKSINQEPQERSVFEGPHGFHPAVRERMGPENQRSKSPRENAKQKVKSTALPGKKPPIPGMRPPMGAGSYTHTSQKGGGAMGIVMPVYTIIIIIFFGYTIMKLICKKKDRSSSYNTEKTDFDRIVQKNHSQERRNLEYQKNLIDNATTRLGDAEIHHLRKKLAETEATIERLAKQMEKISVSAKEQTKVDELQTDSVKQPIQNENTELEIGEKVISENSCENVDTSVDILELDNLTPTLNIEEDSICRNAGDVEVPPKKAKEKSRNSRKKKSQKKFKCTAERKNCNLTGDVHVEISLKESQKNVYHESETKNNEKEKWDCNQSQSSSLV